MAVEGAPRDRRRPGAAEQNRATQLRALADVALSLNPSLTVPDVLRVAREAAQDILRCRGAEARLAEGAVPPARAGALVVPMVSREGAVLGVLELAERLDGLAFDDVDEAVAVLLAQLASVAIENTQLVELERAARADAEDDARLRGVLADASASFAASLDVAETLQTVADLVVPDHADLLVVHLVSVDGELDLALLHHSDPEQEGALRLLAMRYPPHIDAPVGAAHAIRTREIQLAAEIPDDMLVAAAEGDPELLRILRGIGLQSGIAVPMIARGRTLGALTLVRQSGAPYTERERALATELAGRAALAVDTATRYAVEREMAAALQRSLLPQALPTTSAVTAAVRYLPGASGTHVGGDWYDLIELPDDRLAIVVGDVMGRGVPAAVVMGQLRAAVRAYALEGHGPAQLLGLVDGVVQALGDQLTTCLYGVLTPDTRQLCITSAGHPPPLLVSAEGAAAYLEVEPGLPLGVGGATYSEKTIDLPPGGTVLLYTDGLVESRSQPIDVGLAALLAAAGQQVESPDELCDRVLHAMGRPSADDDDTALLAISLTEVTAALPDDGPNVLSLGSVTESPAQARDFLTARLAHLEDPAVVETAILLASELVTNAVRHARSALELVVTCDAAHVRVEVRDHSPTAPEPRSGVTANDESGRGMLLIQALADRWGWEPSEHGKHVWFELSTQRAAPTAARSKLAKSG